MQSGAFNRCAPCDLGRSRRPFVKIPAISLAIRRLATEGRQWRRRTLKPLAERREGYCQHVQGSRRPCRHEMGFGSAEKSQSRSLFRWSYWPRAAALDAFSLSLASSSNRLTSGGADGLYARFAPCAAIYEEEGDSSGRSCAFGEVRRSAETARHHERVGPTATGGSDRQSQCGQRFRPTQTALPEQARAHAAI
jgi:hypothetical protein